MQWGGGHSLRNLQFSILTKLRDFTDGKLNTAPYNQYYPPEGNGYNRGLIHVGTSRTPDGYLHDWIPTLWIRNTLTPLAITNIKISNSNKASFSRAIKTLKADRLIECGNEEIIKHQAQGNPNRLAELKEKFSYYPGSDKYTTHIRLTAEGRGWLEWGDWCSENLICNATLEKMRKAGKFTVEWKGKLVDIRLRRVLTVGKKEPTVNPACSSVETLTVGTKVQTVNTIPQRGKMLTVPTKVKTVNLDPLADQSADGQGGAQP